MNAPFAFLNKLTPQQIAGLLTDETDSTIAATLKALPRELNTSVFLKLPAERRNEIAATMATTKVAGSLLDILSGEIAYGLREKAQALGFLPASTAEKKSPPAATNDLHKMLAQFKPTFNVAAQLPPSRVTPPRSSNVPPEPLRREQAIKQILDRQKNAPKKNAPSPLAQAAKVVPVANTARPVDGLALAASIVRSADPAVQKNLCRELPELYAALKKRMFVFADLEHSQPRTLATVFTGVKPEIAALALRFASDNLIRRVRETLPPRRWEIIQTEIAHAAKRVRLTDIENAQQAVIDYAVELQNHGKIVIDPAETLV